jgi:hypothetical protein
LDGAGHVIGSGALPATGLSTASNGDVLLEGAADGMALKGNDLHAFPRLPANVTQSEARVGENAGFVVEYDPLPGEITRTSPSAEKSRLRLLRLNGWVIHLGQEVPVTTKPGVTRTFLSRDGKVWVLFGADARLTSYG